MLLEKINNLIDLIDRSMMEITSIIDTIKENGMEKILKDEPKIMGNLFSLVEKMNNLPNINDLLDVINESIDVLAKENKEFGQSIIDISNAAVNFKIIDGFYLLIKDAKMSIALGELEDAPVNIAGNASTIVKVLTGKIDAIEAFTSGMISIEGDASEAMKLLPLQESMKKLIE
ncbi:SCP2 sterol-binding domain-containing protein [Candidatus Methanoliparum sp. LAM-1]|uniref:SCP2 sterol-binding domain-containing protein n=1 Tax=Candidatus Methanoliparum sp. LAM-1 TaxID=2874846 RepID=UPI001E30C4E8|nr:SCP2 sterol-binding domain-containing protein [Candidatus Methanoliparum sp. LAM-1]BDC35334.1 hypothetical protein MTLP_00160 [Candidatus Methanoliparum sp. LAM-1]